MRIVFEVVKRTQSVKYNCRGCNKPRTQVAKVENTINPYNRNAQGVPKSREEVLADVCAELKRRVHAIENGGVCSKCK